MSSLPPEVSPAQNTTSPPPPLASPTPPDNGSAGGIFSTPPPRASNRTTLVALGAGIGIGGLLMLCFVGVFVIWYKSRKKKLGSGYGLPCAIPQPQGSKDGHFGDQPKQCVSPSMGSVVPPPPLAGSSLNSEKPISQHSTDYCLAFAKSTFTYADLALATSNFSCTNLLGQGGFGYVHKGVLPDGKEVAIKQLKLGSGQGEREFQAEVGTISRVDHRHLVTLIGYCISGAQRLLVYEYVPNKTLEYHLHGKIQPAMNWATRMKIALGSAKGLAYLHDNCRPKIIHRDIKAANILIDNEFEAKVADFGLAKFYADADTNISTRVMGTFGYLAPEYALSGKLTDKSDVFSFGVVLLELITGRRPIDKTEHYLDDNIVDWARPLLVQALDGNDFDALADPSLQKNFNNVEMKRMVACASVCVRHLARRRPKMGQIVRALEGSISLDVLTDGLRPGESTTYSSYESLDYDNSQYKEDLKRFRKMAFETLGNNSSECSRPTSDFGVHPSASSSEGLGTTQEIQRRDEAQRGNKDGHGATNVPSALAKAAWKQRGQ